MSESPYRSKRGLIQSQPPASQHDLLLGRTSGSASRFLDLSISMGPNELQRFFDQQNHSMLSTFDRNNSLTAGPADAISVSERSILDHDMEQQSLKEKADMLFPQFFEVLQGRTNDAEVFDTIQDLIQTCAGVLEVSLKESHRSKIETTWLEEETNTWKLLYALYKDRIIVQQDQGTDCEMPLLGSSEKEIISQLYACNSTLREYQLIVDWLESCYIKKDKVQVGHTTDRTVGWENTLFQLQNPKDVAFGSGVEIVKSLDPDAPIREKRPLHALDEEDNMRLSKCIFTEIRQGKIDEAMALCKYCGQTWRAAILEGWRLHEDPNYESNNTREKVPIEGNQHRDIWKKCAWMMADCKKFDEYSRAIAGAFCGHLESLKALLDNSWDDLLWAYLKVQIDIRVESEIRSCCMRSYHPMPEAYWNSKISLEQIFDELSVHNDANVRNYAKSKVGIIQKYLILDNIPELFQHMRRWVEDSKAEDNAIPLSAHMLRFLTHIVLFLRQIGKVDKEETADRVIAAYVECLIAQGDAQLVSFYTAALPGKLQIVLYTKFLEGIQETSARSTALEEAINAGLDIENITRHTVETIRNSMPTSADAAACQQQQVGEINEFDKRKIRSLEWLTFCPEHRGELLWQANGMIRIFLGEGKPDCVRATFEMVPADSLAHIFTIYGSKDNLPCREECSIKEYLSYKVYLAAIDSFNDWSHLYHNRPKEPQLVNADANFTERVASEHKEHVYRGELNRWNASLEEQARGNLYQSKIEIICMPYVVLTTFQNVSIPLQIYFRVELELRTVTRDALYNVLLFPEKGWLIDPDTAREPVDENDINWENRLIQLDKLRSICIPEIVLLLHKVLHLSGDFKGCIKLADDIAAETRQIYKVYTKHKLAELLSKLSESSLALLNEKLDPFGFAVTA